MNPFSENWCQIGFDVPTDAVPSDVFTMATQVTLKRPTVASNVTEPRKCWGGIVTAAELRNLLEQNGQVLTDVDWKYDYRDHAITRIRFRFSRYPDYERDAWVDGQGLTIFRDLSKLHWRQARYLRVQWHQVPMPYLLFEGLTSGRRRLFEPVDSFGIALAKERRPGPAAS